MIPGSTDVPPRVSVVMAVFNGVPYLEQALESILGQTFRDFELVIVDDGSTDDSWMILNQYAERDGRLQLHRHPQNRGLIASLNLGVASSHGELVARMDADDISDVGRIEKQVAFLDAHPEVGLLGTGYDRLYDDGRRTRHCPPVGHTELRWRLLFGNVWPHPAVMFRRNLLASGEACYGDFLHAEDYELWVRLSRRTRCATLPEPLISIRTHDAGGISADHSGEQDDMVLGISTQQIEELMPDAKDGATDMMGLVRAADPCRARSPDLTFASRLLVVFDSFARQAGINPRAMVRVRRAWIRRTVLAVLSSGRRTGLLRSAFLWKAIRRDPLALLPGRLWPTCPAIGGDHSA